MESIEYHAQVIGMQSNDYTDDCKVYDIYFHDDKDPEEDGEYWSFSRDHNDDDGVCIAKAIQQITVYEGITEITIDRTKLFCKFNADTSREIGVKHLIIGYDLETEVWQSLRNMASLVFRGCDYAKIGD